MGVLLHAHPVQGCQVHPTTQHSPAEHRGAHWQQDLCHWAASLEEQGFHHRPAGDPLDNRRQASDSQLLTNWVNLEQESRPCHVCPRAFGMVTGRSVSRSIRDWVVVCRRRRLQDRQRLQTFTLATHSYDHPDVPTPQSVRWRLQLTASQLGLQHNIPGWREPGHLGSIQQPWSVVQTKGNSQFLLSPLERRHQPSQDSWLPDTRVLGKFPWSQHWPSLPS